MVAVAAVHTRDDWRGPDPYVLPARVGAFIVDSIAIGVLVAVLAKYYPVIHLQIASP